MTHCHAYPLKAGSQYTQGPALRCVATCWVESARHDARIEPRSILTFFRVMLHCDAFYHRAMFTIMQRVVTQRRALRHIVNPP